MSSPLEEFQEQVRTAITPYLTGYGNSEVGHLAQKLDEMLPSTGVRCSRCKRKRTINDCYDYSPLQAIAGKELGWYSGDDGEICPECMTEMIRRQ